MHELPACAHPPPLPWTNDRLDWSGPLRASAVRVVKWLILNTDYQHFLDSLYASNSGLAAATYDAQMRARNESLFGTADFFSSSLTRFGHEACDVHFNNEPLQRAWALEHGLDVAASSTITTPSSMQRIRAAGNRLPFRALKPLLRPLARLYALRRSWLHDVLLAQVKHHAPDVIVNHDPAAFAPDFLAELRSSTRLLIAQIASPLPPRGSASLTEHDMVVSSLPHFVDRFRAAGMTAEYMPLCFEPRVLASVAPSGTRPIPAAFVGSLSADHTERLQLLEHLCDQAGLAVWGASADLLPPASAVRRCHRGQAWGRAMFEVLGDARVALNHHIDAAEGYANNMRLFEATGMAAMLLTDAKRNLGELFVAGTEVMTYESAAECTDILRYYAEHEDERAVIASAGQRRTLRDHTYEQRMPQLVDIVRPRL